MMHGKRRWLFVPGLALLVACSGDGGSDRKLRVGDEPDTNGGGSAGFGSGAGQVGDGGIASSNDALRVRVQDIDDMTIEVITLACAGDCADILAVASGGNPPYDFAWEDGSTHARRHVCLDASAKLSVEVTDTAIDTDEFTFEAQTVSTEVTANVLDCGTDGGVIDGREPTECDGELVTSDVAGKIIYYGAGAALPSGRYRISYFDGCMKFGAPVNWTIHNFIGASWFLVGNSSTDRLGTLPGTAGVGYPVFDDCVTANQAAAPLELDFAGGKLGVWLSDSPYTDNVEGENGQNPRWCLKALDATGAL